MGYVLAIWLAIAGLVVIQVNGQNNRFNDWNAQCSRDGGVVSQTRMGFWSEQYECFKDGRIINHVD